MNAGRGERRPVRIRRKGRHTSPSQVEKVAAQASKAAPAMAIAGVLVTAPHAQHAVAAAAKPAVTHSASSARITLDSANVQGPTAATASAVQHATPPQHAVSKAPAQDLYYKVRPGDTLSKIARHYYTKASDWQWLYHENDSRISDPNLIFPGQALFVPADPPANYTLPAQYVPRHAKPATTSDSYSDSSAVVTQSATEDTQPSNATTASTGSSPSNGSSGTGYSRLSGTLGCSSLEQLWEEAGGNPSDAFMAAEIAKAESGGNQYALSPTDDYGYWQINASNGALATFNAYGNARSAIILSDDGTNWSAWTTYTSGAYSGRC